MLAKSLTFLANADAAGIVLGARVPIILTSRADSRDDRGSRPARSRCWSPTRGASSAAKAVASGRAWPTRSSSSTPARRASSSRVFDAATATRSSWSLRGQIEGIGTAPRFVAKDGAGGSSADEKRWATARRSATTARSTTSPTGCARSYGGASRSSRVGHRVVHGGARVRAAGAWSTPRCSPSSRQLVPLAPLHQPHNLAPIRRCVASALPGRAAGRLLRHRVPSRPARRSRRRSRCRAELARRGRAALRLPRPVLRVHRRRCCRSRRREPRAGTTRRRAPRQRREHVRARRRARASPARWASPRSTACRWARAAARSIPASCSTCWTSSSLDARAIETLLYKKSGLLGVSGI